MIERLKTLRRNLKLSQASLGKEIGVTQAAIGDVESGRNKLTERNFENICRVFNVNPDWLRNGEGEMFLPPIKKTALDLLAEEKSLTAGDRTFIETFMDLPQESRTVITNWFVSFTKNAALNENAAL